MRMYVCLYVILWLVLVGKNPLDSPNHVSCIINMSVCVCVYVCEWHAFESIAYTRLLLSLWLLIILLYPSPWIDRQLHICIACEHTGVKMCTHTNSHCMWINYLYTRYIFVYMIISDYHFICLSAFSRHWTWMRIINLYVVCHLWCVTISIPIHI